MIDAHVHLGSIPQGGMSWGDFKEYQKIAKKINIEKYCVTPIGKPDNFTNKTTPNNNSVLLNLKKDKK